MVEEEVRCFFFTLPLGMWWLHKMEAKPYMRRYLVKWSLNVFLLPSTMDQSAFCRWPGLCSSVYPSTRELFWLSTTAATEHFGIFSSSSCCCCCCSRQQQAGRQSEESKAHTKCRKKEQSERHETGAERELVDVRETKKCVDEQENFIAPIRAELHKCSNLFI